MVTDGDSLANPVQNTTNNMYLCHVNVVTVPIKAQTLSSLKASWIMWHGNRDHSRSKLLIIILSNEFSVLPVRRLTSGHARWENLRYMMRVCFRQHSWKRGSNRNEILPQSSIISFFPWLSCRVLNKTRPITLEEAWKQYCCGGEMQYVQGDSN